MKLPKEIVLDQVHTQTFIYSDALELIEDMKRLRRTGDWEATWDRPPKSQKEPLKVFVFHLTLETLGTYQYVEFKIPVATVHRTLWPSLYPNDPSVEQLRRWFFDRTGPIKIAQLVNDTAKDPEALPEEASRFARLLSDDDDGL